MGWLSVTELGSASEVQAGSTASVYSGHSLYPTSKCLRRRGQAAGSVCLHAGCGGYGAVYI